MKKRTILVTNFNNLHVDEFERENDIIFASTLNKKFKDIAKSKFHFASYIGILIIAIT